MARYARADVAAAFAECVAADDRSLLPTLREALGRHPHEAEHATGPPIPEKVFGHSFAPDLARFQDADGRTLLHHAAQRGSLEAVRLLLLHSANRHQTDAGSRTAWHIAEGCGHDKIARYLTPPARRPLEVQGGSWVRVRGLQRATEYNGLPGLVRGSSVDAKGVLRYSVRVVFPDARKTADIRAKPENLRPIDDRFTIPHDRSRTGCDMPLRAIRRLDGFGLSGIQLSLSDHMGEGGILPCVRGMARPECCETPDDVEWAQGDLEGPNWVPWSIATRPCHDEQGRIFFREVERNTGAAMTLLKVEEHEPEAAALLEAGIVSVVPDSEHDGMVFALVFLPLTEDEDERH